FTRTSRNGIGSPARDGVRRDRHGAGRGRKALREEIGGDQLPRLLSRPEAMLRVIAIDGPAASGKSSTAGLVAKRLGWAHLDSGALYRALTLAALDNLGEAWPAQRVVDLAERLPVRLVLAADRFRPEVAGADVEEAIRGERVTRHVSTLAALPEVRTWVNTQQRLAVQACGDRGVVVDGRDIGTIVFPEAPLKIFLSATPDERARRRLFQRGE